MPGNSVTQIIRILLQEDAVSNTEKEQQKADIMEKMCNTLVCATKNLLAKS